MARWGDPFEVPASVRKELHEAWGILIRNEWYTPKERAFVQRMVGRFVYSMGGNP